MQHTKYTPEHSVPVRKSCWVRRLQRCAENTRLKQPCMVAALVILAYNCGHYATSHLHSCNDWQKLQ